MEIKQYTKKNEREWDDFVQSSDNGTIFHLRQFLNYHPEGRFEDCSIMFTHKDKLHTLFPAAIREGNILFSHPGASYGGFVVGDRFGLEELFEVVELLIEYAKERSCSKIVITQTPSYYYKNYSSNIDFALHTHEFILKKRELSSVLTLKDDSQTQFNLFPDSVQRAIRKGEKSGIITSRTGSVAEFYGILKNNLSMRHDVTPTHSLEELEWLFNTFPGLVKLYSCHTEGKMIGGIVGFDCGANVNLAFYIAHDHDKQNYRPVDIAIWDMINDSIERGFKYLDFGTFTLNMIPNWGLCRFKEKFGARGVFRDTFECQI